MLLDYARPPNILLRPKGKERERERTREKGEREREGGRGREEGGMRGCRGKIIIGNNQLLMMMMSHAAIFFTHCLKSGQKVGLIREYMHLQCAVVEKTLWMELFHR